MRRFEVVFPVFLAALLLTFTSGCANTRSYYSRYVEAPRNEVFFSPAPQFKNSAYFAEGTNPPSERGKIRYLLDRMAGSKDHFVRNGGVYSGREARQWLLFKLSRWAGEVKTAEDFVNRLSFSKQSGKPYLIESTAGEVYSLKSVLKNELSALETHLPRTTPPTPATLPRPAPVSISPTTVATTAVAHSTSN